DARSRGSGHRARGALGAPSGRVRCWWTSSRPYAEASGVPRSRAGFREEPGIPQACPLRIALPTSPAPADRGPTVQLPRPLAKLAAAVASVALLAGCAGADSGSAGEVIDPDAQRVPLAELELLEDPASWVGGSTAKLATAAI